MAGIESKKPFLFIIVLVSALLCLSQCSYFNINNNKRHSSSGSGSFLSSVKRLARARFRDRLRTLWDYCSRNHASGRQIKTAVDRRRWPIPVWLLHSRPYKFVYCINFKASYFPTCTCFVMTNN